MATLAQPRSPSTESWMLASALFLTIGAAGCSPSLSSLPCMPPDYQVSPSSARPGDVVTVSAMDATCDPRYGGNAQVRIVFTDSTGVEVLNTVAPMADKGGFAFTTKVPLQAAVGEVAVYAAPDGVDWCDDTGKNNRAGSGEAELEMASCAKP